MVSISCPLCGYDAATYRFSERGHRLLQCERCELFFIDPYPAAKDETYDRVADYSYDDLEIVDVDRHYAASTRYYGVFFPRIEMELAEAHRVLDVGCGTGRLLKLLSDRPGITPVGLELNTRRAEYARRVSGCDVHQVPLEVFESDQPFDVITMMNVLSHVSHLDPFFEAIHRLLRPHGKLIMKVGEMSRDVKKSAVHDWSIPDHLHFLGLPTMEYLAQKYRFRVTRHDRLPLSDELFDVETWHAPGRSRLRNTLKLAVARVPFLLPLMSRAYDAMHGGTVFSSLIVLQKPEIA